MNITQVDANYFSVLGAKMLKGRGFEDGNENDLKNSIIVNEALVHSVGWKEPIGQTVNGRRVIGVVGNIYYKSLYNPVEPQLFMPHEKRIVNVIASLTQAGSENVPVIQGLFQKHFPGEPFVYRFLDDTLNQQYSQDRTVGQVSAWFTMLTITISVLGIFGLSLLSAYQRRKEIGIRKIVGATFADLAKLFTAEYLLLVALALALRRCRHDCDCLSVYHTSWYCRNAGLLEDAAA